MRLPCLHFVRFAHEFFVILSKILLVRDYKIYVVWYHLITIVSKPRLFV